MAEGGGHSIAEDTLQKFKSFLVCSECVGTFVEPLQLVCSHIFCRECLVHGIKYCESFYYLVCPACFEVTSLCPAKDDPLIALADHPAPYQFRCLLDVLAEHEQRTKMEKAVPLPDSSTSTSPFCGAHKGEISELYCRTCVKTVCTKCLARNESGVHYAHQIVALSDLLKKQAANLLSTAEELQAAQRARAALSRPDSRPRKICITCEGRAYERPLDVPPVAMKDSIQNEVNASSKYACTSTSSQEGAMKMDLVESVLPKPASKRAVVIISAGGVEMLAGANSVVPNQPDSGPGVVIVDAVEFRVVDAAGSAGPVTVNPGAVHMEEEEQGWRESGGV